MSQIEIRCVDQTAMFTNLPEIFSGDVNIDTVKFTFDDSWNGYTTKTAVFYNNPKDVYPQILDVNDVAVIPSQVMTKQCKLSIGVFGTKANGDVKTSKILTYNVGKGAINSDLESTPATPDFWTQLLARQINFENTINSTVDTLETTVTTYTDSIDTLESIVKGRNQALAYNSYSEMITTLNSMSKDELKRGQNIYIGSVGVPDLWVYGVETTKSTYTYTNDETFVSGLNNNVTVQVGYYKLAQLETQKVDIGGINSAIDTLQSDVTSLTTQSNDTENRVTTLENIPMCIFRLKTEQYSVAMATLPYDFYLGSAVVYNNEIHILGSSNSNYNQYHYKFNGTSWESISTLPYNFYNGCAVVVKGEIHILGGNYGTTSHYKWNGSSWEQVSTLPYNFYERGCAVVYNNEIHILGGRDVAYTKHYKFNGTSWESVSTIPYNFCYGSAVVLNNEIHILGSNYNSSTYTKHYKFNGTSWESISTLPYNFYNGCAVVVKGEIHILGTSSNLYTQHYKWNGSSWEQVSTLPYQFWDGSAVKNKGRIYMFGGGGSGSGVSKKHYKLSVGAYLCGYVKANTNLYLPQQTEPCTDNLEVIEDGYKVTEDGYVEILT